MKRVFKWLGIGVGALIALVALIGISFLYLSPQFGGTVNTDQQADYAKTGHYANGVFTNPEEIVLEMNCHSIAAMLRETMNPDPNVAPDHNIAVEEIDPSSLANLPDTNSRITWLGHSSFLIETGGKKILLDPVFGQYAAPHPLLGRARFHSEMPITISELPDIDAVIISHDHYDHLDYPSINKLKDKVHHFFVPLGVGNHLRRWHISEESISELDWWQEANYEGLKIVLTPSRHMSGRGLTDQSATLWGSWIIQSETSNIYFSGDGGYGHHFKEIGEKYGPFDVGLMECGQYNKLWEGVHMMPEETVVASRDVKAKFIVPIHWGSFALATHGWTDPVERVSNAAAQVDLPLATPRIGESIMLQESIEGVQNHWWENEMVASIEIK